MVKMSGFEKAKKITGEIEKVIKGKQNVIGKVLMAMLADGHILIEDVPGTGKTTLALSFSRAMGMEYRRLQFTPDVVPSDITGFNMYDKNEGRFRYTKGAVFCNLFLADEINRTSSKTQSALLEVMEEGQATVDGETHVLKKPFTVIATQNPAGGIGTQMLPQAQLDRFLVKLSMGYPDFDSQIELLRDRMTENPLDRLEAVVSLDDFVKMQDEVRNVYTSDDILEYMTKLSVATRENPMISLGVSPRGTLALCRMAKAHAYVSERDYVTPEDVKNIFFDVCAHRIIKSAKARVENKDEKEILQDILEDIEI